MNIKKYSMDKFENNGFGVIDLAHSGGIRKLQDTILEFLKKRYGDKIELENYHQFVESDEKHKNLQYVLFEIIGSKHLHRNIVLENLPIFTTIFGSDIDIQVQPYLRVARPGKPQDNIGFHWDTFYGNSAFEVSCVCPLTTNSKDGVLQLGVGSHKWTAPDVVQSEHETIKKGSKENKMGFLYAPKKIKSLNNEAICPILVKPNQVLLFSLGVLHGQETNNDSICRWSVDFRLRNPYSPMSRFLKDGYYEALSRSALSTVAENYYTCRPYERNDLERYN